MTDDGENIRDTLPGSEEVPTEPRPLEIAVRQAVSEALAPVREMWNQRSQDMLDVIAHTSESQVQIRVGVRTMRRAAWAGVMVLLFTGFALWRSAQDEREERIRAIDRGELRRSVAVGEINAHTSRVCGAR